MLFFMLLLQCSFLEAARWDFGRFLKTASYYGALTPKLPFFTNSKVSTPINPGTILWDSKSGSNTKIVDIRWGPLDDVVMGGVSKSDINPGDAFNGTWTGFVTSENNGGFTGIRTKLFSPKLDLTPSRGLLLQVKGDGNRYKFIARDDEDWNGVAWSFSFDTIPNKELEVKIPFGSLKATRFARTIVGSDKFQKNQVSALQVSLSKFEYDGGLNPKFQEGKFALEIKSIKTF